MAEIATRLEDIGSELLADDPKRLKARIRELERAARKPTTAETEDEIGRRVAAAVETIHEGYARHDKEIASRLLNISRELRGLAGKIDAARGALITEGPPPPTKAPRKAPEAASRAPIAASTPPPPRDGLTGPQQRILDALGWLYALNIAESASRIQVAFLAGYKPGTGSFQNSLGSLRTAGLIEYPAQKEVKLTVEGHRHARHPETPLTDKALHEMVLGKLSGPQRRVLEPLIDCYPLDMPNHELADAAGYSVGTGSFQNNKGSLRSLGLIDYPEPGRAVALPVLFPSAAT